MTNYENDRVTGAGVFAITANQLELINPEKLKIRRGRITFMIIHADMKTVESYLAAEDTCESQIVQPKTTTLSDGWRAAKIKGMNSGDVVIGYRDRGVHGNHHDIEFYARQRNTREQKGEHLILTYPHAE